MDGAIKKKIRSLSLRGQKLLTQTWTAGSLCPHRRTKVPSELCKYTGFASPVIHSSPLDVVCRIDYTHCRQRPGLDTIFITEEVELTLAPTG